MPRALSVHTKVYLMIGLASLSCSSTVTLFGMIYVVQFSEPLSLSEFISLWILYTVVFAAMGTYLWSGSYKFAVMQTPEIWLSYSRRLALWANPVGIAMRMMIGIARELAWYFRL